MQLPISDCYSIPNKDLKILDKITIIVTRLCAVTSDPEMKIVCQFITGRIWLVRLSNSIKLKLPRINTVNNISIYEQQQQQQQQRGSAVERQSLASVLSPSCARPVADG